MLLALVGLSLLVESATAQAPFQLGPAPAPDPAKQAKELFDSLNRASLVFTGELSAAVAGPVAQSFPPIYSYQLTFAPKLVALRGLLPETRTFNYRERTTKPPQFSAGKQYLIAVNGDTVTKALLANDELLEVARRAVSVPLGWSFEDDKPISPWASQGANAWPADSALTAKLVCAKSGRPALLAGEGIQISVEQIPPENLQKFKNPFGDGLFKLRVTNTGNAKVQVPALIREGDTIRWHDSLVIICGGKARLLPRKTPPLAPTAVELEPGQTISTTIDTLLLPGDVPWPRGGSRIHFTFCLGELAADNFFYYFSSLHDGMRARRQQQFAN